MESGTGKNIQTRGTRPDTINISGTRQLFSWTTIVLFLIVLRAFLKSLRSILTLVMIISKYVARLSVYSADDKFLPFFLCQKTLI